MQKRGETMRSDVETASTSGATTSDGNIASSILKKLDANSYATKKTIAQGLLDVALLTANASQLKYILQVGEQHEFYQLMLGLIITSIILQATVGFLCLSLLLMRDCRLHQEEYHTSAKILNHFTTACAFVITVLNLIISCFDPTIAKYAVFTPPDLMVAILFVVIGGLNLNKTTDHNAALILNDVTAAILSIIIGSLNAWEDHKHNLIAGYVNHVALGFVTSALFCDVIKMNFGLDPAIAINIIQAIVCVFVGSSVNINEMKDQKNANVANNVILTLNILIVIVNVFIAGFEMKEDFRPTPTTVAPTSTMAPESVGLTSL